MPHIFWVLAVFLAVAGPVIWLWSYNEAIPSLSGRVEPWRLTASVALGKIQADKMSVQEYAESLLERIKARDEVVKAWAYLDEKRVIQEARLLDETPKKNRGPLHGLPIAVKDVIYTKDTPTQFNSPLYDGHFPKTDAASISMALGIQTGGSLIRPASFNGIYGFKPTWNPVSREGRKIYALMYDTLGWYGRCVGDLVLLADIFGLQDDKDEEHAFQGIEGARFAICKTSIWPIAGPGTQDALARAADLLRSHGAEVHELELPSVFDDVPEWYRIGLHTEGRTSSLPEYRVGKDQIGQVLIEHVENSDNFTRKTQLMASDNLAAARPSYPGLECTGLRG
uniref:Amidase domain-containing protein n=1 Tax=Fusarium oxysporum (strain Fo5176) TaxID=660025 RepID=A0A0D2XSI2_FUSOF